MKIRQPLLASVSRIAVNSLRVESDEALYINLWYACTPFSNSLTRRRMFWSRNSPPFMDLQVHYCVHRASHWALPRARSLSLSHSVCIKSIFSLISIFWKRNEVYQIILLYPFMSVHLSMYRPLIYVRRLVITLLSMCPAVVARQRAVCVSRFLSSFVFCAVRVVQRKLNDYFFPEILIIILPPPTPSSPLMLFD
jgi:hypothetical protein